MYGSSAAGGVVNVFDGRIPTFVPEGGAEGAFRYSHSTVDDGDELTGAINARVAKLGGADLVLHGDALYRKTEDYKIPGYSESAALRALEEEEHDHEEGEDHDEDHEEAFGVAENSATETKGGSVGAAWCSITVSSASMCGNSIANMECLGTVMAMKKRAMTTKKKIMKKRAMMRKA